MKIFFYTNAFIFCTLLLPSLVVTSENQVSQKDINWDFLVFAQRWAPSACLDIASGKCSIPKDLPQTEWIIHGLWPTNKVGYPSFCNSSWKFQDKELNPILPLLTVKWPNLIRGSSGFSFWKHEWMKHGTCATSVSSLNGVLKYFNHTLGLESKFNLYEIFRKISFVPSKSPYLLDWIIKGISLQLNTTAKIICKSHKDYKYPLIDTIYLCMDKSFNLINCDITGETFCSSSKILYPPFPE